MPVNIWDDCCGQKKKINAISTGSATLILIIWPMSKRIAKEKLELKKKINYTKNPTRTNWIGQGLHQYILKNKNILS